MEGVPAGCRSVQRTASNRHPSFAFYQVNQRILLRDCFLSALQVSPPGDRAVTVYPDLCIGVSIWFYDKGVYQDTSTEEVYQGGSRCSVSLVISTL